MVGKVAYPERMGWTRTCLLALGAALGVLATAAIIHLIRRSS